MLPNLRPAWEGGTMSGECKLVSVTKVGLEAHGPSPVSVLAWQWSWKMCLESHRPLQPGTAALPGLA